MSVVHLDSPLIGTGLILITATGTEVGCTLFGSALATQSWQEDADAVQLILVHCMFFLGSIVGGLNAGYFIDSIGRKHTLVRGLAKAQNPVIINYCLLGIPVSLPENRLWLVNYQHSASDSGLQSDRGPDNSPPVQRIHVWPALRHADRHGRRNCTDPDQRLLHVTRLLLHLHRGPDLRPGQHVL